MSSEGRATAYLHASHLHLLHLHGLLHRILHVSICRLNPARAGVEKYEVRLDLRNSGWRWRRIIRWCRPVDGGSHRWSRRSTRNHLVDSKAKWIAVHGGRRNAVDERRGNGTRQRREVYRPWACNHSTMDMRVFRSIQLNLLKTSWTTAVPFPRGCELKQ